MSGECHLDNAICVDLFDGAMQSGVGGLWKKLSVPLEA